MSELANRRKLFISHLSALGSDGSNQHAILPSPTMSFSPSPLLALLSRTSDYDLKQAYWHKPEVYKDNIGKYYIDTVWKRHLDFHGYTRSFQPLQGTERERYLPIIDRAHREEVDRIKNEELLLYRLSKATEVIEMVRKGQVTLEQPLPQPQVVDPPAPVKKKRGRPRKQPQPEDIQNGAPQPAPQSNQNSHVTGDHNVAPDRQPQAPPQYEESAKLIKAGIRELEEFIALRKPLRHARQYPEFAPFAFDTHYGCIIAKNQLHQGDWFMGHRPGDPIMRIVDAPRLHKIFGPDDAAHHPVFGREDFDIAQLYFRFRHEGIVPFNYSESQQRLEEHAFPAFLTMIIAALAFNPNKPEAEVPPPLSRIWTILAQDMASMDMNTKDELVRWMSVLQRIWKIKYGTDASKLPRFLKGQFAKSGSRLGEMAWLVCKVMSMSPGCHTLRCFVDWFLQAMVGANMQSVANWYLKYQLGREAQEQMQEGDIENIFFYRSNRPLEQSSQELPVLQDIYNRHGSYRVIPTARLDELQVLARRFVPHLVDPSRQVILDPIARTSVPISPNEVRRILTRFLPQPPSRQSEKASTVVKKSGEVREEEETLDEIIVAGVPQKNKRSRLSNAESLPSPPTSSPTKKAGNSKESASTKRPRPDTEDSQSSMPSKRARK